MSTVRITAEIDLAALPFPASCSWDGTSGTVTADVPEAELAEAVKVAPRPSQPPDQLATLLADLSKATTLAQVRAAASKAAGA